MAYILRTENQVCLSVGGPINGHVLPPKFCNIDSIPLDRIVAIHPITRILNSWKRWTEGYLDEFLYESWDKTNLYIECVDIDKYEWLKKEWAKIIN